MALFNLSEFLTIGILNKSKNPVFRIKSINTGQEYVLKKLQRRDFEAHLADFAELTYILRCCHHPNIIKILGFSMNYVNNEYNLCLLMDLYKTDLQRVIESNSKNNQQMSKKQIIMIIKQLVEALNFMQTQAKIAHRDIKPANILLDSNDNPIITDFSEAHFADNIRNNQYIDDGIKGTPEYMSPELRKLFLGSDPELIKYNPWVSDVYSLGVSMINLASSFDPNHNNLLKDRLQIIEVNYGSNLKEFLEVLVQEDQDLRGDFKILIERKEFLNLIQGTQLDGSPTIKNLDNDIVDRISIIVEDEKADDDDNEDEVFGRLIEFEKGPMVLSMEKNKDTKEIDKNEPKSFIHFVQSPKKKMKGNLISLEMKELKEWLKTMGSKGKLDENVPKVFKKIIMEIKDLELENRVILKEMKIGLKKSNSMKNMNFDSGLLERRNFSQSFMGLGEIGGGAGGGKQTRKSMNIIYNIDSSKQI